MALRINYPNQKQLTFKELLEKKNKTVSIHQTNLKTLQMKFIRLKARCHPSHRKYENSSQNQSEMKSMSNLQKLYRAG